MSNGGQAATQGLRFDHVAQAVPDIGAVLSLYVDVLGGRFVHGGANERVGYRGVVFAFPDGRVELIEPLDGSSFLDSFFARHPGGGLHHVTFHTPLVREMAARAATAGYEVVSEFYGDPYSEAFLHPRSTGGALLQFSSADGGLEGGPRTLEEALA